MGIEGKLYLFLYIIEENGNQCSFFGEKSSDIIKVINIQIFWPVEWNQYNFMFMYIYIYINTQTRNAVFYHTTYGDTKTVNRLNTYHCISVVISGKSGSSMSFNLPAIFSLIYP